MDRPRLVWVRRRDAGKGTETIRTGFPPTKAGNVRDVIDDRLLRMVSEDEDDCDEVSVWVSHDSVGERVGLQVWLGDISLQERLQIGGVIDIARMKLPGDVECFAAVWGKAYWLDLMKMVLFARYYGNSIRD